MSPLVWELLDGALRYILFFFFFHIYMSETLDADPFFLLMEVFLLKGYCKVSRIFFYPMF